ncbi:MAG: amidohydrolase family protein [Blastocatellia bacterium]|nr:amidohydrolase family protein [Blastocatellia bacterium]
MLIKKIVFLTTYLPLLLIIACANLLPAQSRQEPVPQSKNKAVAFINVNVVPMDREHVLVARTVIVRDGIISEIGPAGTTNVPDDALRIDGRGRYLMPGLADLHIHLRSTDEFLSYLAYGVTTVLHLSGAQSGAPDLLEYRERLARNEMLGPTLYTSGPVVDGDPPIFRSVSVAVTTAEGARRVVAEQKRAGYDLIKVYNRLPPEAYTALIAAAKKEGLAVVGHIPRQVGVERALDAGQAMIAHGEEYFFAYFGGASDARLQGGKLTPPDETKIPGIAKATRDAGTAVTPNLSFIAATERQLEDINAVLTDSETRYLHPNVLRMWKSNNFTNRRDIEMFAERERIKYPFVKKLTRGLSDAGVLLLLGTDSSAPGLFPGQSAHLELRELVSAGLTPYQALATGTRNAGEFITKHVRRARAFGTVSVGARADLLLLAKNPLEDISNVSALDGVMVRGQWLSAERLKQLREEMASSYEQGR